MKTSGEIKDIKTLQNIAEDKLPDIIRYLSSMSHNTEDYEDTDLYYNLMKDAKNLLLNISALKRS